MGICDVILSYTFNHESEGNHGYTKTHESNKSSHSLSVVINMDHPLVLLNCIKVPTVKHIYFLIVNIMFAWKDSIFCRQRWCQHVHIFWYRFTYIYCANYTLPDGSITGRWLVFPWGVPDCRFSFIPPCWSYWLPLALQQQQTITIANTVMSTTTPIIIAIITPIDITNPSSPFTKSAENKELVSENVQNTWFPELNILIVAFRLRKVWRCQKVS